DQTGDKGSRLARSEGDRIELGSSVEAEPAPRTTLRLDGYARRGQIRDIALDCALTDSEPLAQRRRGGRPWRPLPESFEKSMLALDPSHDQTDVWSRRRHRRNPETRKGRHRLGGWVIVPSPRPTLVGVSRDW